MRYRAKVELYDEFENRVEVAWAPEQPLEPGDKKWPAATWKLALELVRWIRERRDA